MKHENPINPGHSGVRMLLRIVGPILLIAAGVLVVIAFADFVGAMGNFGRNPEKFHYFFIAMPLGVVGFALTSMGFAGAVARYQAQEYSPVAKDTINYLGRETHEGVSAVAAAIAEGVRSSGGGSAGPGISLRCPKCNAISDADARFCSDCGEALTKSRTCPDCGELNDSDARFCDACGRAFSSD